MKKVFNSLCIFLAALFISCGNLNSPVVNNPAANKSEYNVKVNIVKGGAGTSRTVTSVSGVDFASLEWAIDFFDESSAEKIGTAVASKDGYVLTIEPGSYVAKASADYVDSGKIVHKYYGESEVVLEGDEKEPVVVQILVGLKKTDEGKGNIKSIVVDLSNVALASDDVLAANLKSIHSSTTNTSLTVTLNDDKKSAVLSQNDIPSGYYYLQILHNGNREIPVSDYLVEIADDENVTGNVIAFDLGKNRIYYATTGEGSDGGNGGGLSENDRIKYDVLMTQLKKENQWETVDIFMTEDPVINLDDFRDNRKYKFSVGKTEKSVIAFEVMNGQLTTTAAEGDTVIKIKESSVKISSEEKPFTTLYLYEGASVQFVDSQETTIKVILDVDADYVETPFAAGSEGLTFNLDGETADKYAVIYAEGKYALVKTGTGTVSIGSAIPDFELTVAYTENGESIPVTNQIPYTNGSVTISAVPLSEDLDDFAGNTVFEWKINDFIIDGADSAELVFNPTTTPFFMNYGGSNVIQCYASNEGEMQSSVYEFELISHFFVDPGVMLWNGAKELGYSGETNIVSDNTSTTKTSLNIVAGGMQAFTSISNNQEISNSFLEGNLSENGVIESFCFDKKLGDVYLLTMEDSSINILKYDPISREVKKTVIVDSNKLSSLRSKTSIITSMTYLDGYVYIARGISYAGPNGMYKVDVNTGNVSEISLGGINITSVTTDGRDLYISYITAERTDLEMGETSNDMKLSVAKVSNNSVTKVCNIMTYGYKQVYAWTFVEGSESFESVLGIENVSTKTNFIFKITDMQVIGNNIYALLTEDYHTRDGDDYISVCRGGLIKMEIGSDSISVVNLKEGSTQKILGWYVPAEGMQGDSMNPLVDKSTVPLTGIFYGPRKFIAIKPDELWIADEGIYKVGDYSDAIIKQTNKAVKVDLNTMSISSATDVNVTLSCQVNTGCGFLYY